MWQVFIRVPSDQGFRLMADVWRAATVTAMSAVWRRAFGVLCLAGVAGACGSPGEALPAETGVAKQMQWGTAVASDDGRCELGHAIVDAVTAHMGGAGIEVVLGALDAADGSLPEPAESDRARLRNELSDAAEPELRDGLERYGELTGWLAAHCGTR